MLRRLLTVFVALLLAACSGETSSPATSTATTTVATTTAPTTTEALLETVPIVEIQLSPLPASTLWATFGDGTLARLNGLTAEIDAEIQVGSVDALEVGLGQVWLASCDQQVLIAIDAQMMDETGRWDLGGCPADIAITGGVVLAAVTDRDMIVAVNPLTDEVTEIIEIGAPTTIDAGSPILVGTADGKLGLWDRSEEGKITHAWTQQFAGQVIGVDNDLFGLVVLVQAPDGSFWAGLLDTDNGNIVESFDLDFFQVFGFFVQADWIFVGGGLPSRVWDVDPDTGTATSTEVPANWLAPDGDADPSGAYALGGDDTGSTLYRLQGGSNEVVEVGEMPRPFAEGLAAQPVPNPCGADLKRRIAAVAASGEARYRGDGKRIAGDAEALVADVHVRLLGNTNPAVGDQLELAFGEATTVIELGGDVNDLAFEIYRLGQKALNECDESALQDMADAAGVLRDRIDARVAEMALTLSAATGHRDEAIAAGG